MSRVAVHSVASSYSIRLRLNADGRRVYAMDSLYHSMIIRDMTPSHVRSCVFFQIRV